MKTIFKIIIAAFVLIVPCKKSGAQSNPQADPAVITITKQGPGDPAPLGTNIAGSAVLKFRVANNSGGNNSNGKIPAGAVFYTIQFNPYYTYSSMVASTQFAVTYASPGSPDYVVQLTNTVDINPGDVFDFYLNVVATQPTTNPSGEIVTMNVDRNIPIQCGNLQTGNDNVFKAFTVSSLIPLPVNKLDLLATLNTNNTIDLKWTTVDETNTSHFIIERSADGINFSEIGTKPSVGNSVGSTDYTMIDSDIAFLSGLQFVYYRVRLVDLQGPSTYSRIVMVRLNKSGSLTVWPNPFRDKLQVQIKSGVRTVLTIRIYNAAGSMMTEQFQPVNAGQNSFVVSQLDKLGAGYYTIVITDKNNKIASMALVKQ